MKVVIFIGHFKTGSTSLQTFLSRNSAALSRAGILYPAVVRDTRPLPVRLASKLAGREQLYRINRLEAHNLLALRLKTDETGLPMPWWYTGAPASDVLFENMRNQIEKTAPQSVLLISEHLAELGGVDHRQIRRLKAFFAGCQVTILATLRRPDTYICSWHGQRLKAREVFEPLRTTGLYEYLGTIHIEYDRMIRPWRESFPDADLQIKNHADIMRRGGSIASFLEDAGVVFPEGLKDVPPGNLSVPYAFREILRHGVRDLPPVMASNLVSWTIRNRKKMTYTPDRDIEMFGTANRARLMEAFAPSDAYLTDLTGKKPMFPDLEEVLESQPVPELAAAREGLAELQRLRKLVPPKKPVSAYLQSFDLPPEAV